KKQEEPPSEFENFIRGNYSKDVVLSNIKQFGYNFFTNVPSSFAPIKQFPVSPDYIIGPGDEIKLSLWGSIQGQYSLKVSREGKINIPGVGEVYVNGVAFKDLKNHLYSAISKYYKNFELSVSMGDLRTITVYVVGFAKYPGTYTVSSLSTLINALFESGGPSKNGSMRKIQLIREGKIVTEFDMYDFLIKGDKTKDHKLQDGDVIYIPPIGNLVAVAGSVKNPAIYELKNEKTVKDVIELAGGLSNTAYTGRVQIERIQEGKFQKVFEEDLEKALTSHVKPGDVIKVYQVIPDKLFVYVSGAVQRPGSYGYKEGMMIKDLLDMAGGLKYYAYKEAELVRVIPTQNGTQTERFKIDLEKALAGDPNHNIKLLPKDSLIVRSVPEWESKLIKVTISGEVRFPGTYVMVKGDKLSTLIEKAGGFTERSYLKGAVFLRKSVQELQQKSLDDLIKRLERETLLATSSSLSTAVSPEEVSSKQVEFQNLQKFIATLKELKATGRVAIKLSDPRVLKRTPYDVELEDGDLLYIPQYNPTITVMGAVMSPGSYIYDKNLSWKDYVKLSGGLSNYADEDKAYVIKADGTALPLKGGLLSWNNSYNRWEISALTGSKDNILEPGDVVVIPEKMERIAWLRNIKDITQILMQIAVTAGVVIKLY
ncbi:MAG: SLBB domain-containing protein, partial [Sulfurihydrogenibium sp.]|uniref:SLBB domain-containing protein n=1 Tax=Sulfurihydrogenibium sp. TaxID=2053621 RepID=UPI003C7B03FB